MTHVLVPKPGKSPEEVNERPSMDNAFIYDHRGSRIVGKPMHATPQLRAALNPKRPEEYLPKKITVTRDGEQISWTPLPDGKLGTGENPFFQLIYRAVMIAGNSSEDDIVRVLIDKHRVFPMESWAIKEIKDNLIKTMNARALIVREGDGYKVGLKLKYDHLVDFTEGYDPRLEQVVKLIRSQSTASYANIHDLLIEELQWVEIEKSVKELIKGWMQLGILTEEVPGWYRVSKSPEPNIIES